MTDAEGCKTAIRRDLFSLIPAHAGVIPVREIVTNDTDSYPRARGGDPCMNYYGPGESRLSPRTRG